MNTAFNLKRDSIHHVYVRVQYMLLFNFILGLNFIIPCFKPKNNRKIKFKPRINNLNHNIHVHCHIELYIHAKCKSCISWVATCLLISLYQGISQVSVLTFRTSFSVFFSYIFVLMLNSRTETQTRLSTFFLTYL